jgi:hypothetical protein
MGGFDCDFKNSILDKLDSCARNNQKKIEVYTEYIFDDTVRDLYPHLDLKFNLKTHKIFLTPLASYNIHPEQTFENFLCSFNGSPHVSRKLLVSILNKLGLFDPKCSTKNFGFSNDHITGHLQDFIGDRNLFYDKFFVNDCAFNQAIYTEDFERLRYDHSKNIYTLESRITSCFVHLVSETLATSYYPYYGEKFLYSVVCRGLFVAYSNPLWHCNLEKYYGFKLYSNLFDYEFDLVKNPVDRLIKLVSMLLKFSHLSTNDWHDLYTLEMDTIEYNYDHYFSGNYLQCLEKLI